MVIAVVAGFAFVVGYYGLPFVMSLYLQQLRGLSAARRRRGVRADDARRRGLTPFSARLAETLGARQLITAGLVLMAAGCRCIAAAPPAPGWALAAADAAGRPRRTAGHAAGHRGAAEQRPRHRAGTASGVFNTSRQLGGALAVAVFGALLASPRFVTGLRVSLLIAAAVALAAAAVSTRLTARPDPEKE